MSSSFAYKKYSAVITASMGKRPLHSLRDVLLMSWLGPSSFFNLIIATVPTAKERELQMSMKLCPSQNDFDEIAVVTTYILLYGQLSKFCAWITHHDIPVLPLIGFGRAFYYYSLLQMDTAAFTCLAHNQPYIQALMVWFHKSNSEKDSPSLSPWASISAAAPQGAQLPLRQKLLLLLLTATTSELVHWAHLAENDPTSKKELPVKLDRWTCSSYNLVIARR